jgi:hypothetical protein
VYKKYGVQVCSSVLKMLIATKFLVSIHIITFISSKRKLNDVSRSFKAIQHEY